MRVSRRAFLASLASLAVPVRAQQRGAAFPVEALTQLKLWDDAAFLKTWDAPGPAQRLACRMWPGPCELFGVKAHGASAFLESGRLRSITLLFLDAGAWFGFKNAGEETRVPEFLALHKQTAEAVEKGVNGIGTKVRDVVLGGKTLLKHTGSVANHGDVWSRLVVWPQHLVKLTLFRDEDAAVQLLAPYRRAQSRDEQARTFASLMHKDANGDRIIRGIPLLKQGDRAYCGMSALAMMMQHLGLRIETEELAGAAGIRFGITKDAKTREMYDVAADIAGLRMDRTQKFEFPRVRAAIEAGMPVVVFRRWSKERDYLHTTFARRFPEDPAAMLPRADMNDRKLWPQRGEFVHASIVNGFNVPRGEVIFTESWSEQARDRRMRIEEMEGTSYMACQPRFT